MSIPTVQVTCVAYDQNGNPVAGGTFRFKLDRTEIYNGFVVPEVVEGTANAQGVCVVNLWPNALGTNSSQYRVQAYNPDTGAKYLDAFAVIPDSNCYLQDVIQIPPFPPIDQSQQALIAAQAAASAAAAEADLAAADADAAAASAASAAASASAAATSVTAAANSATSASGSASTATTAAQSAQTSAGTATTKASEASTSAVNAAASATSAATSASTATTQASSAASSAVSAASSATSAQSSANTATTKASEAAASAAAASSSATSASASAATATTKATEAQTSASNAAASASGAASSAAAALASETAAASSANSAASSATSAQGSATTATTQASIATTKATEAAASSASAQTSATNASGSATAASGSASAAQTAQVAAESARDQTLAAFDSFDDRYLGAKATDPTTDNDGNPLVSGALYYNTNPLNAGGGMKVYDGTAWLAAYASLSGALLSANNLSDLASAAAARINLGLSAVAASGSYADLVDEPTALSQFTNDTNFITASGAPVQSVAGKVGNVTLDKSDVGLANVENKSSATIRSEITSSNVTTALGFTPYDASNPAGYLSGITSALVQAALGYVPVNKAGDTMTGLLAGTSFSADYFDINTGAAATNAAGRIYWNAARGVPSFGLAGGNVALELGETAQLCYNAEATPLVEGEVVYLFGAHGDLPSVKRASNASEAMSTKTLGVVTETIAAGSNGFVTTQGIVNGLNTSAYAAGTVLWLGDAAGTYTNVKPVAPAHMVFVGVVTKSNAGNGSIFVKPQNGYELDELHDVLITSPATNDFLVRAADGLWKNRALASSDVTTALGFTPYDASNPSGYITSAALSPYLLSATAASTYLPSATAASTYLPLSGGALSGNLTFSGAGRRIIGDFDNGTLTNRLMFQTSTVNGVTDINFIPNGTGTESYLTLNNNSDPLNGSRFQMLVKATEARIEATRLGTGSYLPVNIYTSGLSRVTVSTTGAVAFSGSYGTAGQALVSQGSGAAPVWGSAGISTGKAIAMAIVFGG